MYNNNTGNPPPWEPRFPSPSSIGGGLSGLNTGSQDRAENGGYPEELDKPRHDSGLPDHYQGQSRREVGAPPTGDTEEQPAYKGKGKSGSVSNFMDESPVKSLSLSSPMASMILSQEQCVDVPSGQVCAENMDVGDEFMEMGEGNLFCSNTSIATASNYPSTLLESSLFNDSALLSNPLDVQNEMYNDKHIGNSLDTTWTNADDALRELQRNKETEGCVVTPRNKNHNVRLSIFFLSSLETDEDVEDFGYMLKESPKDLSQSSVTSLKASRTTEPVNEIPLIDTGDSDKGEDEGAKMFIFHKALKPLRPKLNDENMDIGLYFLLKQGGIDTEMSKSLLKDSFVRMSMHFKDFSDMTSMHDFKKWYEGQVADLYQKYHLTSSKQDTSESSLAKLVSPVEWARKDLIRAEIEKQKCWNPFSIFGSAPATVHLQDVFDYNFYKNLAPLSILRTNSVFKALINMEQLNIENGLNDGDWPKVKEYLERRWKTQASLDCDWQCDELEIDEVFWYLNIMSKYQDKSKSVYTLEPCYCVTPNPQLSRGLMWNDPRCNPVYPRPSLFSQDSLINGMYNNNTVLRKKSDSLELSTPLQDLPDTPEIMDESGPENWMREPTGRDVQIYQQAPLHPYADQSYQMRYGQYHSPYSHSPYNNYGYSSQPVTVSMGNSGQMGYEMACVNNNKRHKGLEHYNYQPARMKQWTRHGLGGQMEANRR